MKKMIIPLLFFLLLAPAVRAESARAESVCVYLFYSATCPVCAEEKVFLRSLNETYPIDLHEFEIYYNDTNSDLLNQYAKSYDVKLTGVPVTFIGSKAFSGFGYSYSEIFNNQTNAYAGTSSMIEKTVREYSDNGVPCPTLASTTTTPTTVQTETNQTTTTIKSETTLPVIANGESLPLPVYGALLGLIDGGFNPCALSVLFFLIAYLLAIGSRKKSLTIGLIYAFMVFTVYTLFMYGMLNVLFFVGYLSTIKTAVGIIIILLGLIELKDFFFYGKGLSLEIPGFAKSTIERLIKVATVPSAIILGLVVSIVEIPCAGAFPFIYLTMLAEKVSGIMSLLYILWYNLFFVLPLVIMVAVFNIGLVRVEKAEQTRLKTRKYMRLLAGLIMLALGLSMVVRLI